MAFQLFFSAFRYSSSTGISVWGVLFPIRASIHHQEVLENPQTHSLTDVILSYRAMREAGRESWGKYAREKAGIRDLQDMSKMIILMKETGITTVEDLAIARSSRRNLAFPFPWTRLA